MSLEDFKPKHGDPTKVLLWKWAKLKSTTVSAEVLARYGEPKQDDSWLGLLKKLAAYHYGST